MLVLKGLVGLHRTYGLFMLRYDRTQHNSVKQLSLNLKNEWVTKNIFWHQICNLLFKYESPRANFHSWNAKSVHFINEYQDTDFSTWNLRYFMFHIKKTWHRFPWFKYGTLHISHRKIWVLLFPNQICSVWYFTFENLGTDFPAWNIEYTIWKFQKIFFHEILDYLYSTYEYLCTHFPIQYMEFSVLTFLNDVCSLSYLKYVIFYFSHMGI